MFKYTGVDGIMVGRAALGHPWIIKDIKEGLSGETIKEITNMEKLKIIKEHLCLDIKEKGEYIAIREMRKHICAYVKNLKESSRIREKITRIEDSNELITCLEEYFRSIWIDF